MHYSQTNHFQTESLSSPNSSHYYLVNLVTRALISLKKGTCSLHRASLGLDARNGRLTPQKWSEKASSNRPRTPECQPFRDKMSLIGLICLAHQPIKLSFTDYLAMFTRFWSHTRILGKGNLLRNNTHLTNNEVALEREASCSEIIE